MTAAYRLKGLGWFGSCVAIVLGFYLVSLQVAAERKKLDDVNGRIRSAARDIRALETEFDTRANLAQLEKWNGDTLALSAPTAGQFVADESALAAIDVNAGGASEVQTAALVVPSLPVALPDALHAVPGMQTSNPTIVQTAMVTKSTQQIVHDVAAPTIAPSRHRDAFPVRVAATERTTVVERAAAMAKVRPQAVAMLDRKLLSDNTIGDILSGARAEAGRLR